MSAGTFPGCGGSEELISVSLGMVPRRLRVAAVRVMRPSLQELPQPLLQESDL